MKAPYPFGERTIEKRDFYFRALGSLVVLSFPQPLNISSVLPSLLSETLTRRSNGCSRPVDRYVLMSGAASLGPCHVGPRRSGMWARLGPVSFAQISNKFTAPFSLSLSRIHSFFLPKLAANLEQLLVLFFLPQPLLLALGFTQSGSKSRTPKIEEI